MRSVPVLVPVSRPDLDQADELADQAQPGRVVRAPRAACAVSGQPSQLDGKIHEPGIGPARAQPAGRGGLGVDQRDGAYALAAIQTLALVGDHLPPNGIEVR
jgi:hypothetical protein